MSLSSSSLSPIYCKTVIKRRIQLLSSLVGESKTKSNILKFLQDNYEGRCVSEGYVRTGSIEIIQISAGLNYKEFTIFNVEFECLICLPVKNMLLKCVINKPVTKAGIHADIVGETPSPMSIFIAKDNHYNVDAFSNVQKGDQINVRVLVYRYQLNDKFITVIGQLVMDDENEDKRSKN